MSDLAMRAAAAGAAEALRNVAGVLMRPGTITDVDSSVSPAVVTVAVDGDSSTDVYGHALGGVPAVGGRCVVAFVPPQAVFVFGVDRPWNVAWGRVGYEVISGTQSGITTVTDITGMAVSFDAVAGRTYRVEAQVLVTLATADAYFTARIRSGSTSLLARVSALIQNSAASHLHVSGPLDGLSGSTTLKLSIERQAGTGTASTSAFDATRPDFIEVVDAGPTP